MLVPLELVFVLKMRHQILRSLILFGKKFNYAAVGASLGFVAVANAVGAEVPSVRISELMYKPTGGDGYEFIELYNSSSAAVDLSGMSLAGVTYTFPANTTIPPGGTYLLGSNISPDLLRARYPGVTFNNFYTGKLANDGETISLLDAQLQIVDSISYKDSWYWTEQADGAGYSLELADIGFSSHDPANWRSSSNLNGSPGQFTPREVPPVRLNEILAVNVAGPTRNGDRAGYYEIHNAGTTAINLNGWSLSKELRNGRQFVFTDLPIAAGGYAVVWSDQAFAIDSREEMVFLYNASSNLVDAVHLGTQLPDLSVGRIGGNWQLIQPSPGANNVAAAIGLPSSLVINEWYANALSGQSDWFELYNGGSLPISLRGLIVGNGKTSDTIRSLSFIAPGGFAQIFADETAGANHVFFKLPAANGTISLANSTGTAIDSAEYVFQSEASSEGRLPDGSRNRVFFAPAAVTPGASNTSDSDGDGLPNYFEIQYGLNPALGSDAALDADGDKMSNLQEFLAATSPTNAASLLKLTASKTGDQMLVSFQQQPNHSYSLLYKDSLTSGTWLKANDFPAVATTESIPAIHAVSTKAASHRFFKVVTPWVRLPGESLIGATFPNATVLGLGRDDVRVQFREPLNPATVSTNVVSVKDDLNRPIAGKLSVTDNYSQIIFEPDQVLLTDTTYTVSLAAGIQSKAGESLPATNWTFRTAISAPLIANQAVYTSSNLLVLPEIKITTLPVTGGFTLADLLNDDDPNDTFNPSVPVHVQVGQLGAGTNDVNGQMEVRGQSTRWTSQKSFKVDLNGNATSWFGQEILNLNKHPYDLTRVRNKFAFDLFKQMSNMVSLRTSFADLTIDNQDFGFFTHVEQPDENFLAAHGLDAEGYLYKPKFFEFQRYENYLRLKSDLAYNKATFEEILEIKGNDNHGKLLRMLDDVNNEEVPINEVIKKHFNRDNYLTWLAANLLMGNRDTASQNFYLYSPRTSSTWYFIPWDYDGAWGFYTQPDQLAQGIIVSRWTEGIANYWNSTLHRRFIQDPQNWRDLQAKVQDLYTNFFTASRMTSLLDTYKPIVRLAIQQSPDFERLPTVAEEEKLAEWDTEYLRLTNAPTRGFQRFVNGAERPMPIFLGNPQIESDLLRFFWSESYDLQGDGITYDFQVSRTFGFEAENIVASKTGLTATTTTIPKLPSGSYFWRIIIRDTKNPTENWQVAFDTFYEPDFTPHFGMANFVVP